MGKIIHHTLSNPSNIIVGYCKIIKAITLKMLQSLLCLTLNILIITKLIDVKIPDYNFFYISNFHV